MKQIAVISGKGGTGKTVIAASLAALGRRQTIADCDVDAANLHLLLDPQVVERHRFVGQKRARVLADKCTSCLECLRSCRFNAISETQGNGVAIDPISCEGCFICRLVCPSEAIEEEERNSGEWFVSETSYGPMVHARLGVAEENSGKLVALVRQNARRIAEERSLELVLVDGPPGIGCPVIAALSGVDMAVVVAEPTLSSIHDVERVAGVATHFGIDIACVVNKHDINPENSQKIEEWCDSQGIPVIGRICYDPKVVEAVVQRRTFVEDAGSPAADDLRGIWQVLMDCTGLRID